MCITLSAPGWGGFRVQILRHFRHVYKQRGLQNPGKAIGWKQEDGGSHHTHHNGKDPRALLASAVVKSGVLITAGNWGKLNISRTLWEPCRRCHIRHGIGEYNSTIFHHALARWQLPGKSRLLPEPKWRSGLSQVFTWQKQSHPGAESKANVVQWRWAVVGPQVGSRFVNPGACWRGACEAGQRIRSPHAIPYVFQSLWVLASPLEKFCHLDFTR